MKKIISSLLVVGIIAINFGGFLSPKVAMAASLTAMSDTVSNLTASATASHVIKFTTPTGIPASKTVILTFDNSTSTTGVIFSDVTVLDGATPVTVNAGAPTTTNWGFANASPVITFTTGTGTIAAGHIITITFSGTNKITNGSAGTTTLAITGSMSDSGVLSMAIIANGVVAVSASVLGSITFSIDANSISFGTLSAAAARYANATTGSPSPVTAVTLTAGTNAPTGYSVSVQGDTLTTTSGSGHSITPLAASTASATGSEQFGINLVKGGTGTLGTISAPYATVSQYAYTGTTLAPATIATASGATNTNTYAVSYIANIAALTPAGSYTTAHTYVATGNF